MRFGWFAGLVALLHVLIPGSVAAVDAPAPLEATDSALALAPPVTDVEQLFTLWRVRAKAAADGDTARADSLLDQIVTRRRDAGTASLDDFAAALLREARVGGDKGEHARAALLLEQARQLAPGLPEIEKAAGALALAEAPYAVHRWLVSQVRGLWATLNDFQRRALLLSDVVLTVSLLLVLLGALFVVSQLLRHGLSLYHDLGQVFPSVMKFVLIGAGVLAALLPLYYGFGPLLLLSPLAVLLWSYQSRGEKALTLLFVVLLGAAPWAMRAADRLTEAGTGLSQALYTLSRDPGDARAEELVAAAVHADPDDWQASWVLGLAYKRRGDLDLALRHLDAARRKAPEGSQEAAFLANNLGNVHFAAGRLTTAGALYEQARRALPTSPEPRFNLSRLHQRRANLAASGELVTEASRLDADRVAAWGKDVDLNLNRYVVDLDLPSGLLTQRELASLLAPTPLAARAWRTAAGPLPEMVAPIAAGVTLLVLLVLTLARDRMKVAVPCHRCARAAIVPLANPPAAPVCEQCETLFVRNVPVDRRIRFDKETQIARYQALRRWGMRLSGLVFPGFGALLRGRALRGALVAGLGLFCVLRFFLPDGLLLQPALGVGQAGAGTWFFAGLLLLLWVWATISSFREASEAV